MRPIVHTIIGVLGCIVAPGLAVAQNGGIGSHPPAFLADILQPAPAKPYLAVCVAPPVSCDVDYMYPIRSGKTCWCRSGLFTFTSGTTRALRATVVK